MSSSVLKHSAINPYFSSLVLAFTQETISHKMTLTISNCLNICNCSTVFNSDESKIRRVFVVNQVVIVV